MLASAALKDVEFTHTGDVGYGYEVHVSGPHPLLGSNDPLRAPKLSWSDGNIWRGKVALPAGANLVHRFIKRPSNNALWANPTNTEILTEDLQVVVPEHPAPPWNGKTILAHLPANTAFILHRDLTNGSDWTDTRMERVDAGRQAGESLFRVDGIAPSGAELEFVFHDGKGNWFNPSEPITRQPVGNTPAVPVPYQNLQPPYNFRTSLDVLFVQDRQIFNYRPPASLSEERLEARPVQSTVAGIPPRYIRIFLPRGYDENTWKRYPVVYFHDGQNIFYPGGAFGSWDAGHIAEYETMHGRMRECIIVGIYNADEYGSSRLHEYLPDGDTIGSYNNDPVSYEGRAAAYLEFILANVAPTIDFHYRTFGADPANTITAGSSMGGLVSDYLAASRPDRFGTAGIFSPAYWAAPNYMGSRATPPAGLRAFLSMGTAESSAGESGSNIYWEGAISSLTRLVAAGRVHHRSIRFEGVPGGIHNEPAWSGLLPSFYSFALDVTREANPLALELFPPTLEITPPPAAGSPPVLRHMALIGATPLLESSTDLTTWQEASTEAATEPWDVIETPAEGTTRRFWRLHSSSP
jgi:predicted alpha/beta superfamily hydrolase